MIKKKIDCSWDFDVEHAFATLSQDYVSYLHHSDSWLPGISKLFAAFSLPKDRVKYVLLGESPYPRSVSANGYAFWDASITNLWSGKGLSKGVNKATSLRNIIKMLLCARGDLTYDVSQDAISKIDKTRFIQTVDQLFYNLQNRGVFLLNATLVYSPNMVKQHVKEWHKFIEYILKSLIVNDAKLILWGKFAEKQKNCGLEVALISEHPYNNSFIRNQDVHNLFKNWDLLLYDKK